MHSPIADGLSPHTGCVELRAQAVPGRRWNIAGEYSGYLPSERSLSVHACCVIPWHSTPQHRIRHACELLAKDDRAEAPAVLQRNIAEHPVLNLRSSVSLPHAWHKSGSLPARRRLAASLSSTARWPRGTISTFLSPALSTSHLERTRQGDRRRLQWCIENSYSRIDTCSRRSVDTTRQIRDIRWKSWNSEAYRRIDHLLRPPGAESPSRVR